MYKETYEFAVHLGCRCSERCETVEIEFNEFDTEFEKQEKIQNTFKNWLQSELDYDVKKVE